MIEKVNLISGLLIQKGSEVYKVSNLHNASFTAQQVLPVPGRTRVLSFHYDELFEFSTISRHAWRAYENAYKALGKPLPDDVPPKEKSVATRHHPLIAKAANLVQEKFTKEELIELGDVLDGDDGSQFMDAINEHLMEDSPEVFGMVDERKAPTPSEMRTQEAAKDPNE